MAIVVAFFRQQEGTNTELKTRCWYPSYRPFPVLVQLTVAMYILSVEKEMTHVSSYVLSCM